MRRRQETFRISHFRRTYDRTEGKFSFNISYETHTQVTQRSLVVAEAFGLGIDETQKFKVLDTELKVGSRDVVYITGTSGSGKSVLLRAIKADLGEEAIDLNKVTVDPDKPLIETVGATVEESLELLSKVGLNDAFLFLRSYSQLSDGQKFRYKIAKLIESKKSWWLVDEFCSCLDRDTAKIIAFNLQKIARHQGKAAIVATAHSDLFDDLAPNVHVIKQFGEEIRINYYPSNGSAECSLTGEMVVQEGGLTDWHKLSSFHYRGHNVSVPRKIFRLMRGDELIGVIVYSYPPIACHGRRLMLPQCSVKELNKKLSIINRVVIHPKYRSIGLGAKLIRDSLPLAGTPYVEMVAVMAKYSPFAEKAGMKKIIKQEPAKNIFNISRKLIELEFNLQLLGSERYIKNKLAGLTAEQIRNLKETFIKNRHMRFKREFAINRHQPFGKTADFIASVQEADLTKISKLIKIVGILMQEKVYLLWRKQ